MTFRELLFFRIKQLKKEAVRWPFGLASLSFVKETRLVLQTHENLKNKYILFKLGASVSPNRCLRLTKPSPGKLWNMASNVSRVDEIWNNL